MGCLDDLAPPTTCPGGPQHAASDCVGAIGQVSASPVGRCFGVEEMACLAGSRECTCLSDECPVPDHACYPPPDCPAAIRGAAGASDAECMRLDPSEIGAGFPSELQCICGCSGCATVCDGSGPVLGVLDDGDGPEGGRFEFVPPFFDVRQHMPEQGKLGVYLRLRGFANTNLLVLRGTPPDDLELLQRHVIVTPLTVDFVDQVVFDQDFIGVEAYSWDSPDRKPEYLMLYLYATNEEKAVALYELDCLIPFVVPL